LSERTFKIDSPTMEGDDIAQWQSWLTSEAGFGRWNIDYPLEADGFYGPATRAATASFMRAWGVADTGDALGEGLTARWRTKLRNNDRLIAETTRSQSDEIKAYRAALRDRYATIDVCYPVSKLVTDAWGWHPGVHDGVDLVTPGEIPALAIVTGTVVRVSASGWWGSNPQPSPGHPISDGDGIIIIESAVNIGPFEKGMHFAYGHAEKAVVREGQDVRAGQVLGMIGFARAWHTHFMVNDIPRQDVTPHYRGVGDRDPQPFLQYARDHS
jgi:murein DD-endopeptidase MepM/ murein hydrolase activator NlpD